MLPLPHDITPLSQLDYPGKLACILWFKGCNLRCPYCYNPHFVEGSGVAGREENALSFLKERAGFLDAVVLSGGEASLQRGLPELCRAIKKLGYAIKLDTNGSNPEVLEELLSQELIDAVALDHKMPQARSWKLPDGTPLFMRFAQCLELMLAHGTTFEVRSTVHPLLLDEYDIINMVYEAQALGYRGSYSLQYYFEVKNTLGKMPRPTRNYKRELLLERSPLRLQFRNFPDEILYQEQEKSLSHFN